MLEKLGVKMVTIPLPFRLNHVNCFVAESDDGFMIVDTGLHDANSREIWEKQLEHKTVSKIVVTHLHIDHSGYAGTLQQLTGAKVFMSEKDSMAMDNIWRAESLPLLERDYSLADVPNQITEGIKLLSEQSRTYVKPFPVIDHYLQEGEQIQIGKEIYEVIFTPGHSDGLITLFNEQQRVLFSTDHILPKITPNIASWFYGDNNPLQSYERSLHKIKELGADFVIPSHGEPFYNANKRIDEIWQHHLQRFAYIHDLLEKGGQSVFSVCEKLFSQRLSTYDYQFAIGETLAHLEYLRIKGECQRELQNGKWVYRIN